jgi:hypothetical protein
MIASYHNGSHLGSTSISVKTLLEENENGYRANGLEVAWCVLK